MNIRERREFYSLKRKIALLIVIILSLFVWIKNIYDSKTLLKTHNDELKILLSQKDSLIKHFNNQLSESEEYEYDEEPLPEKNPNKPKKKNESDTTSIKTTKKEPKEKIIVVDTTSITSPKTQPDSTNE